MPLIRRVPKFGFHSPFRVEFQVVNVSTIEKLVHDKKIADGTITPEVLYAIGVISKRLKPVKILGEGALTVKVEISANAFSKSALQKIEGAGGKATTISSEKK